MIGEESMKKCTTKVFKDVITAPPKRNPIDVLRPTKTVSLFRALPGRLAVWPLCANSPLVGLMSKTRCTDAGVRNAV